MYHRHEPSSFEITSNGARSLSNKTPTPGSNFVAEVDPSTCSINAVQFDTTENIETRLREVISKKDEGAADRFWWINGCRCPANAIAHFGSLCGLHHLTLEDIASESNEKSEIFSSQRYMYSVLSNGPRSPSWVLYSLLDAVVESMVPECEKLIFFSSFQQ